MSASPAAFVSYSRTDTEFVMRLAEDLKAAGARIWLDQLDIPPGERWDRAVEAALNTSPVMLVVLSAAAIDSMNVMDEVSFALQKHKIVVPILIDDCPIPFRLHRIQHVDFRRDYARGLAALLTHLRTAPAVSAPTAAQQPAISAAPRSHTQPSPPPPPSQAEMSAMPEPPKQKRPAWFWVAICAGAVAVVIFVLIVAAIAIPNMMSARKYANQSAAIATLHTIATAQITYNAAYPENGYACGMETLGGIPGAAPTAQAAQLVDPTLAATGQNSGYKFDLTCTAKIVSGNHDVFTAYRITAVPLTVGKTGSNGYCADETNAIKIDPNGGTNCTEPLQ